MDTENDLLEKKETREKFIGRTEVLDKVGELMFLPNTEYATTKQVAKYYKVDDALIRQVLVRNNDELVSDGVRVLTGNELSDIKSLSGIKSRAKQISVFPKRAILRVGMLLRDSKVAKEVRTRLLDIVQDTEKSSPEIIQNIANELTEEKQLMLDRVEAEVNGDYDKVCTINAKLFALKNKRIKELEEENKNITTNALTISESKNVINKIVRTIGFKEYNGVISSAYKELYSKANYKLGINIKARGKKHGSYLNSLTEEETFKLEKIVRNWATDVGLDLDKLLKIS